MDVTRTAITFLALVAGILFFGFAFDVREWPMWLTAPVVALFCYAAAKILELVDVAAARAQRERKRQRDMNTAAHEALVADYERGAAQ